MMAGMLPLPSRRKVMWYSHFRRSIQLPGYDLYCNFTGFDVAASAFKPEDLDGVDTIDLSYNKFVGEFPQVNSKNM